MFSSSENLLPFLFDAAPSIGEFKAYGFESEAGTSLSETSGSSCELPPKDPSPKLYTFAKP